MGLAFSKTKFILFLTLYVLLACLVVYLVKPAYLYSILIVLVPPALVTFWQTGEARYKIFIFSLVTTFLFAPPIELATRLANAWDVQSIFPRPFGLIPLENMLFAFLNFFWVVSFYEFLVKTRTTRNISPRFKYLIGLYLLLSVLVFFLYFANKELVVTNYSAMAIPILILPGAFVFVRNPKLLSKTVIPTIFFALVFFVYEIVSIEIGSWWWPGKYILSFHIDGHLFPLDDVIIWYFLSTPVLIGGYEYFINGAPGEKKS